MVYVDDMAAGYKGMKMHHLIADTEAELHAMADLIGVQRCWYQGDHYDISISKRKLALAAGAVPITWRECGIMAMYRRKNGVLPKLAEVGEIERQMRARAKARMRKRDA